MVSRRLLGLFVGADDGDDPDRALSLLRSTDAPTAHGDHLFIGYLATRTSTNLGFMVLRMWCLLSEALKRSQDRDQKRPLQN